MTNKMPKSKIAIKKKKWSQLRRAHTNKQRKVNIGTWRLKQTMSYINFLQINSEALSNILNGQKSMIYNNMASAIRTRTSLQCRSHHQKTMKTHESVQEIIRYYSKVVIPFFKKQEVKLKYQKYLNRLRKPVPFYKVWISMNTIRIEIDQSRVRNY